ncbi:MAG: hypothetical protein KKE64_07500 [Candidatus Omnitrophica bacterium]|nr:hypothetical protein [Candidatus Omnitrophota bacterium]
MDRKEIVLAALAASNGAEHTPVQVQKLFFVVDREISQLVGGPFFNFVAYDYGPFDSDVYNVLRQLGEDGNAETLYYRPSGFRRYKLTAQGQEKGTSILQGLDKKASEYIVALSGWIRKLSFAELVSAIYKAYPEMKANSVFRS